MKCEICEGPAVHFEYFNEKIRAWCESHTPWSGHYEHCPVPCKKLKASLKKKK
jgi:hypothetical protein